MNIHENGDDAARDNEGDLYEKCADKDMPLRTADDALMQQKKVE